MTLNEYKSRTRSEAAACWGLGKSGWCVCPFSRTGSAVGIHIARARRGAFARYPRLLSLVMELLLWVRLRGGLTGCVPRIATTPLRPLRPQELSQQQQQQASATSQRAVLPPSWFHVLVLFESAPKAHPSSHPDYCSLLSYGLQVAVVLPPLFPRCRSCAHRVGSRLDALFCNSPRSTWCLDCNVDWVVKIRASCSSPVMYPTSTPVCRLATPKYFRSVKI